MRLLRLLSATILSVLIAGTAVAAPTAPVGGGTGISNPTTVLSLPVGSGKGRIAIVTDGQSSMDCTIGGGGSTAFCYEGPSSWRPAITLLSTRGLEFVGSDVAIKACSATGQVLLWDDPSSQWDCGFPTASVATNLAGGNSTTLLGSMPYQSDVDTTTLLAPNTADYAKFLRLRGTGVNGAAPEWVTSASYQFIDAENTAIQFATLCDTSNWAGAIAIEKTGWIMRYCSDEPNPTVRYVALGDPSGWAVNAVTASTATNATNATNATKSTNLVGGNSTTLLGSMPYQSDVDTTTLLAPNTSDYAKFLRLRGTGTNGAAPEWVTSASYQFIDAENTAIQFETLCDTNNWAGAIAIEKTGWIMRYCSDEPNPTVRYVALGDPSGWAVNATYASSANVAATASTVTNVSTTNADNLDTAMYPLVVGLVGTQTQPAQTDIGLSWDSLNNALSVSGAVSGNTVSATGTVTGSQLISTVAFGTPPIDIAAGNTTKVVELNCDLVDGYDATTQLVKKATDSMTGTLLIVPSSLPDDALSINNGGGGDEYMFAVGPTEIALEANPSGSGDIIFRSIVGADTYPRFDFDGSGYMRWSSGVSTFDTELYRSGINTLSLGTTGGNDNLYVPGSLTAGSQLISQVATGTAPLQVASTTLVTNLNAQYIGGVTAANFAVLSGQAGGQTLNGGTAASENLTLSSTANATKGKILFGTSGYNHANNRLGIGNSSPAYPLDVTGVIRASGQIISTLAAGTPPIDIAAGNTDKVVDLNCDLVDGYDATTQLVKKAGDSMSATLLFSIAGVDEAISINNGAGLDEYRFDVTGSQVVLEANPAQSGDIIFRSIIAADTIARFDFDGSGYMRWGTGLATPDTELYRSGGSTLSLGAGDSLVAPGNLTAMNQLISQVASGTPPLIVSSSTLVSNLNAQYIGGVTAANFAVLPGQAGGQTLNGGTAAGEDLVLSSTANATKGSIFFGATGAGNSEYDQVNKRLGIGKISPTVALDVVGAITASGTVTAPTFSGNATTATTATTATKSNNLVGGNSTTLLGAMPYQSNVDTTTLLSPNTANYAKFLRLRGTGTNGAAPEWVTSASYQFIDAENTPIQFATLCDTNNWAGAIAIEQGGWIMRYCSDEPNPTVRYVALGDPSGWAVNATYASSANVAATASTATNATNIDVGSAGTDSTTWVLVGGSAATGNQQALGEAALNYNASSNTLYSTNFNGAITVPGTSSITFTGAGNIGMAAGSITGIGNGSTTTPSISFTGDSNTGLYHSTGDSGIVGFTSQGGTQTFVLNPSYAESSATFRGPAMMFTTSGVDRFLLDQSLSAGQPTRDGMALTNYCDHYNGSCNSMEIYTDSISATPPAAFMGSDIDWYMDDSSFTKSYMGTLRYRWDVSTAGSERTDFQIYAIGTDLGTYPYFEIDGGSDTTILATPYEATTSGYPVPVVARIRSQAYDKDLNPTNRPGDVGEGGQLVFMANNSGSSGTDMVALEFSWDDETATEVDGSFHIKLKDDNNWAPFLHMVADFDREASVKNDSRIYPAKPGLITVASAWIAYNSTYPVYLIPNPTDSYIVTKCGVKPTLAWASSTSAWVDVGHAVDTDGFLYQANLKSTVPIVRYAGTGGSEAKLGAYEVETSMAARVTYAGAAPTAGKALVWCEYALVDNEP